MSELSDPECIAILCAVPRDPVAAGRALSLLFQRYDRRLQCHLRWRNPALSDEDLQETCQETWIRVWQHLSSKVREEAFHAWMYRIGEHLAIDLIRRKARRAESSLGEDEFASKQPDHVHDLAFAEQLKRCADKLPERLRDFTRRLLNLETYDEIAAALKLPRTRIYQIKHEVGKLLADCMEQGR